MFVIAGVNGAGKSTLYEVHPELFSNTERINDDEVLRQSGGDWRNPNDSFKAMKEVLVEINTLIATKTSFHWESTLSIFMTTQQHSNWLLLNQNDNRWSTRLY